MRKKNIIMLAILLLAVSSGILFYTRPMSISQICSGIDVAECKEISGFYRIAPGMEDISFEVNPEYEKFGEILELFESQKFNRSIASLLPQGMKMHTAQDDDFKWEIRLEFEDIEYADGSLHSGNLITVSNFFGDIGIQFNGNAWDCDTADKEVWLSDVMSLILDYMDKQV